ncbi:MAG: hypothetical protein ACLTEF_04430 [[Clostridium] leptum]
MQITAPNSTSDDAIRMFAVSRISWIKKTKEKLQKNRRDKQKGSMSLARIIMSGDGVIVWIFNILMFETQLEFQAEI